MVLCCFVALGCSKDKPSEATTTTGPSHPTGTTQAGAVESAKPADSARADAQKLPKGADDGIVGLPNGEVLVSSWDASGVYRGKPGGAFSMFIEGVKAPADIGYDTERNRVLVPLFQDNEVRAYDVE